MSALWILITALFVQFLCAQVHKTVDGIKIKTVINLENICTSDEGMFAFLLGLSIEQCVQECGLRKHCVALNFKRRANVCELLSSEGNVVSNTEGCIHIHASDIEVMQKPCTECAYGEVCDINTRQCIFKECLVTVKNGRVLGNDFTIGAVTRYKCNGGYTETSGVINATCLPSGQWSAVADCQIACGDPPSIGHGTAIPDNDLISVYSDTATVNCEPLYKASANKITCTATGIWEEAFCYECYAGKSWEYTGKKNVTETGIQCQRWDSQTPRHHIYTDVNDYPETTLSEAENYCRNPSHYRHGLWCYTSDASKPRWELCGIPEC